VTTKPTKAQTRARAVAERQKAADAAATQRRNRLLLWGGLAAVVVLAVVVAVVGSGGSSDDASGATKWETASVSVSGTPLPQYDSAVSPDPAVGDTIPTLEGKSVFDGTPVKIAPDGKPQLVLFVAHWCPHCQAEVPRMVSLAKDGVFDGVHVTAVATGTNEAADNWPPSAWLHDVDWPFAVLADSADGTAAKAYGLSAYPYFVFVAADGTVAGRGTGELTPEQVTANIAALKAGKSLPLTSSSASSSAS
jgi:thiol-disulfide isomerase/thioredoxin